MNFPNASFRSQGLGIQPVAYKLSFPNHSVGKKTVSSKKSVRFSPQVSVKRAPSGSPGGPPSKKRRVTKTVNQSPRKSSPVGRKKATVGKKTVGNKKASQTKSKNKPKKSGKKITIFD